MNKILILSLFLSLAWHSSAFMLFKIAEPYNTRKKEPGFFMVSLHIPSENIGDRMAFKERFSYNDYSLLNTRFTLPVDDRRNPVHDEIEVDFEKKLTYFDREPDGQLHLVDHQAQLVQNDQMVHQPLDAPQPEDVDALGYEPQEHVLAVPDEPDTSPAYTVSIENGTIASTIDEKLDSIKLDRPCSISFSIDRFGRVHHVILEKSSGNTDTDAALLTAVRTSKFERKIDVMPGEDISSRANLMWGRIVFYMR